jgi:predicted regulator of Ras-like GTPase activity (Roadblock/LC7/MglB family)
MPMISSYDSTNHNLRVSQCVTTACIGGNSFYTVDKAGDVGSYNSITIGMDGLPVIAYYDATNGDLKVAKCTNKSCMIYFGIPNTITTVDSVGDVGMHTSITIGTDGLPVISYNDWTNGDLKVAKCATAACTGTPTITTLDSAGLVGFSTSITIGMDGLPVISYKDGTNGDLKVAKCGNSTCSSGTKISTVDSAGHVGDYTSITIGTDGLPVISYYDQINRDLKVAKCATANCSGIPAISTMDSVGSVGSESSITIGTDGLPVISYLDATNGDLKVAKCGNAFCLNNWTRR